MILFESETADVDLALANLSMLLSPAGATAFLGTEIGPYLSKRAKERFSNEGDDVVGKWQQLSPATVAIRQEAGFPGEHPINRRTGELENWVVQGGWDAYPHGLGASMRFPGTLPTGELKKKVETAQSGLGDARAMGYTPPRPVLGVNETDMIFMLTAFAFAVEVAVK